MGLAGPTRASDGLNGSGPSLTPRKILADARTTWRGFARVLGLVWETHRFATSSLLFLNLVQGSLPAARVWIAKLLVDAVVLGVTTGAGLAALPQIAILVALQFVIGGLANLTSTLSNIQQQLLQERVTNRIQLLLMTKANNLDLAYFERPEFYDLIQQAQREAAFRPVAMVQTAFGLVRQGLTFLSMLALLVNLEWIVALAALLTPIPAFISGTRYGWQGYVMMRHQSPLRRMMNYLTSLLTTDSYSKEIKLFTVGDFFIKRYQQLFEAYFAETRRLVVRRYLAGSAWLMLTVLANSATFLYVALRALTGRVSVGDLTLYVQAVDSVQQSFQGLLGGFQSMYEHQLYLTTLFELLDFTPGIIPPENPIPLARPITKGIEFRDVTYTYDGKEEPALEHLSFTISPGETVAVVGHNGAGKTTLVKLLTRLYDPQEGQILLDGHDIREYDPDVYRAEFGVLFQDYVSYHLTARENIGVGRTERLTDTPAIEDAANQSGASSLIKGLPEGYDTVLGKWFDGGVQLSGGEWQKVALARAFIRDAQILILDEPSAALDAKAEFELFTRLRDLTQGRTAIFISHRFSTVRRADRILVLEGGRLIEEGTHESLMALGGRYAELFDLQAASYR